MGKNKAMKKKMEQRSSGEVRAVEDEGVVTAYLTKWDTVDSWRSKFEKGSFANTFSKRGAKGTRLIWNHNALAGKILELREDDIGPLATVKFNLETRAGQDAYNHIKAEDVECFSFGFNVVKERWVRGVRSIQEVDMLECGPVVFQANDEAVITDVRSTDYDQTITDNELSSRGWKLIWGIETTIDDIFWEAKNSEETITLVDTAIGKFHTAYMQWLNEYYDNFESRKTALPPREIRNGIQAAINNMNVESLTAETSLTKEDVSTLTSGKTLPKESRHKLSDLPESFQAVHQREYRKKIEALANEIRASGLSAGERDRIAALLGLTDETRNSQPLSDGEGGDEIQSFFKELRSNLFNKKQ